MRVGHRTRQGVGVSVLHRSKPNLCAVFFLRYSLKVDMEAPVNANKSIGCSIGMGDN